MKTIKVLSVFGTRPEAIKMAPLIREMETSDTFQSVCCVTAQHREMLDSVLDIFKINPDFDLNIMTGNQTITDITIRVLFGLQQILLQSKPDIVLVHGDTSTTLSAALAGFYQKIPVGHVEAGLRSFDKYSPYPEEMNRTLVSRIASLHFCPTINNKNNLIKENIRENLYVTGNTVIDAMKFTASPDYQFQDPDLQDIDFNRYQTILITAHRRENYGEPMKNIFRSVLRLAEDYPNLQFVYPVHPAPTVFNLAHKMLSGHERIHLIEPVSVEDMHNLIARSYLVLTDSGGLQEEAPSLGIPVLVMRHETERPEAIEAGTACLVGTDSGSIYAETSRLLNDPRHYHAMAHAVNPYGDGTASQRILSAISSYFLGTPPPDDFNPLNK